MAAKHQDFGEKIGGAKKDLWGDRGLFVSDLDAMNQREADHHVKKDNIWKRPDYQALIDDGVEIGAAYFIKKVRDALSPRPLYRYTDHTPELRTERQKQYVQTVRDIQTAVENVRDMTDVFLAFRKAMVDTGYLEERPGGYGFTEKAKNNPLIEHKLLRILRVSSERQYQADFVRGAQNQQFGVPKEQKVPAGYSVHLYTGGGYSARDDWESNTYYVTKGYAIIQTNIKTYDEAVRYAQGIAKKRSNSKQRYVPPQLANVKRSGADYRRGKSIKGQDYLDAFGFRGGEFGNWMNQNDRQASLDMGFDALKDLAAALQISDKDIAFQGTLSIAFGARGSGNAVAHYEPLRKVINLTKMRGAGSLAHEWWHGLDDYLGTKKGCRGYLSEHPRLHPLMKKLLDTIRYKPETPEQAAKRTERNRQRLRDGAEFWLKSAPMQRILRSGDEQAIQQYEAIKQDFLEGKQGSTQRLNELHKAVTGRVIPKSDRDQLETYEYSLARSHEPPEIRSVETNFYRNSKLMGSSYEKDGGYWDSEIELTARAFACYVMDKLKPECSDYLCGHAECAIDMVTGKDGKIEIVKAYPQGAEREAINAVFDELIADLKREQILTHSEKQMPLHTVQPDLDAAVIPALPTNTQQLSMFDDGKPSVLAALAAAREQAQTAAGKQPRKRSGVERT